MEPESLDDSVEISLDFSMGELQKKEIALAMAEQTRSDLQSELTLNQQRIETLRYEIAQLRLLNDATEAVGNMAISHQKQPETESDMEVGENAKTELVGVCSSRCRLGPEGNLKMPSAVKPTKKSGWKEAGSWSSKHPKAKPGVRTPRPSSEGVSNPGLSLSEGLGLPEVVPEAAPPSLECVGKAYPLQSGGQAKKSSSPSEGMSKAGPSSSEDANSVSGVASGSKAEASHQEQRLSPPLTSGPEDVACRGKMEEHRFKIPTGIPKTSPRYKKPPRSRHSMQTGSQATRSALAGRKRNVSAPQTLDLETTGPKRTKPFLASTLFHNFIAYALESDPGAGPGAEQTEDLPSSSQTCRCTLDCCRAHPRFPLYKD